MSEFNYTATVKAKYLLQGINKRQALRNLCLSIRDDAIKYLESDIIRQKEPWFINLKKTGEK